MMFEGHDVELLTTLIAVCHVSHPMCLHEAADWWEISGMTWAREFVINKHGRVKATQVDPGLIAL